MDALAYLQEVLEEITYFEYEPDQPLVLDSLIAAQVKWRIELDLDVDLPLADLLRGATLRELAGTIGSDAPVLEAAGNLPRITPDPERRFEPFPLNDIQEAYWLGRQSFFDLGNVATHFYSELEAVGLDLDRAEAALNRVVARHGMLRAVVGADGRQRVLPATPRYKIAAIDASDGDEAAALAAVESVRSRLSHEVRPVDQWPLFEVVAIKFPDDRVRLAVSIDLLIADGLGVGLFFQEWSQLYADLAAQLPSTELSFRDYVLALEELEHSPIYERARDYWRSKLASLPSAPVLPLAKPLSAVTNPQFVRHKAELDRERWARFTEMARRRNLTPSVALCAAYAEVLARWADEPRFTVNVTVADRLPLHPEVGQIVGNFTSVVLLEADRRDGPTFEIRATELQRRLWEALEHRHFSGVRVLRELGRANHAVTATMPVVFSGVLNRGTPNNDVPVRPAGATTVYGISQTPQVYLDNQVVELEEGGISIHWDGIDDLAPCGLFDAMLASYIGLLEDLADREEAWSRARPVRALPAQVATRDAANATEAPEHGQRLEQLFHAQAARTPDAPALITADRVISYGELRADVNRLARALRARGARPGRPVAVLMPKSAEQVAAAVAIVTAGAPYLPVDPNLPDARRDALLRGGEIDLVVASKQSADLVPAGPWTTVLFEEATDLSVDESSVEPAGGIDDLAYVLFTSGSTGAPKGVAVAHRGPVNTIQSVNQRFAIGAADRTIGLSSLSFDLSVFDVFGTFAAGAALVLPDAERIADPHHWARLTLDAPVTVWNSVPAYAGMLADLADAGRPLPDSLRVFLLSGDWIPVALPDRLWAHLPTARVVSLGGPTETSIWNAWYEIGAVDPTWRTVPYGRPLPNRQIHILDGEMAPVPDWVAGELYCGGIGLADGYWGDPEQTAKAFVIEPRSGQRLYRSGDLGRWRPDGTIELLGRTDDQVQVHGYRVEPGEVEAALGRHAAVRDAAVVPMMDECGQTHGLCAYVATHNGRPETRELTDALRSQLPAYMVPSRFVFVDALPRTANGKLDRRALAAPVLEEAPGGNGDGAPPSTPTEKLLAEIWASALDLEVVGIDDDFFAVGGDSLLALQIMLAAEAQGFTITPREVFEHPTIAAQATLVESRR